MLIYTVAIVAMGLTYVILNRKNKIGYAFAICFISIAFLMLSATVYVVKIGNYTYINQYDYSLYISLLRMPVSIFKITDIFYLSLSLYMIGIFLMFHILDRKKRLIKDIIYVIIICVFFIINSSYFSLELNRLLHVDTDVKILRSIVGILPDISEAIFLFYLFFIPCELTKIALTSNLSFKRKYILLIVVCEVIMSLCVYVLIVNGMASDLNFHNIDLRRFPINHSEVVNSGIGSIIIFITLLAISIFTFYYNPFEKIHLKRTYRSIKDLLLVNNNFAMYLHTYKNSFNSVRRIAELIEEAEKCGDRETLNDCLHMLKKLSEERIEHINRLSGVLKVQQVNFEKVDLIECIKEALKKSEMKQNINSNIEYGMECGYVYGDRQILTEVFLNLINNAVTSMNKKMQQKDFVARLDIKMWNEEEYIVVKVRDNGTGIGKADFKSIFKMFYSTNERQKYCGVGLRMVEIGVRMHKGYIYVDSTVGEYAEFTVVLPCLGRSL